MKKVLPKPYGSRIKQYFSTSDTFEGDNTIKMSRIEDKKQNYKKERL